MTRLKIILSIFLCQVFAARQLPAQRAVEKGVIEGQVTDAANRTVLAGVDILVYKEGPRDTPPLLVTSDSSGHFVAEDLDPGRYRLVAQRNGYVTQKYGERARNRDGIRLTLYPDRS